MSRIRKGKRTRRQMRIGVPDPSLTGNAEMAAAQLAGEDFLVGLDWQRVDTTGQQLAPVPGLASTTAAGLAQRFTDEQ